MHNDEVNEYLKTIGTVTLGMLLIATVFGLAVYHLLGE
jgi:hypothetical protein